MAATAERVEWLGVSETGRLLGVSAQQVRRLVDGHQIGYLRTKYGRLCNGADVARLAQERAARRQTEAAGG